MPALSGLSCIFPCLSPKLTARYYMERLGFTAEFYLDSAQPYIRLYCGQAEIILTQSKWKEVVPNRQLYGYELDAYIYTEEPEALYERFLRQGVMMVKEIQVTEEQNKEFVVEDIDGRYLAFGKKMKST